MTYAPPIADMRFVLSSLAGLDELNQLPGFEDATPDLVDQILDEAGKLAANVIAPLNAVGDRNPPVLENGVVRMPSSFKDAYEQYRDAGWNGVPFDPEFGGQGLPWAVGMAVQEMWQSACVSFSLCSLLNQGAVEALEAHASDEQKAAYLPKLITGEWTGTMNLTEPHAGSDVGAVRSKAVPDPASGDGAYRITGQKIYITYGEHDLAENIVHLVLARTPDAPDGTRGISLFAVPKYLANGAGGPGKRNDLRCVSLEHKMGIHASPTCVMAFGDTDGAVGYLIGDENQGMRQMFTMMNNARLSVGLQGVAMAERAYQAAVAYARDRVQGKAISDPSGAAVPIIRHPDVRRMLLDMKAQTEAARALTYFVGAHVDLARRHPDGDRRKNAQLLVDLLTPVVKAWSTDIGFDVASTGVQVHGGMGYVEETGAAQLLRDARIAPIYEGTNGIQAADLVFRKVARDGGEAAHGFLALVRQAGVEALASAPGDDCALIARRLGDAASALEAATGWLVSRAKSDPDEVAAGAAPYLQLFGIVAGGFMMARSAIEVIESLRSPGADHRFLEGKLLTARYFAEHFLPLASGLATVVAEGGVTAATIDDALL